MSTQQRLRGSAASPGPATSDEKFAANSPVSATSSSITPAVPASTIYKLLFFTAAMFTFPLLTYFGSVNLIFGGNSTYAGASAAVMANAVLFGYIIVAVAEDQEEDKQGRKGGKIE